MPSKHSLYMGWCRNKNAEIKAALGGLNCYDAIVNSVLPWLKSNIHGSVANYSLLTLITTSTPNNFKSRSSFIEGEPRFYKL
ncbi:MAG: hypothetical protein ACI93R_002281 [Flavobacteriales bacterium]|jgi:hypothetical protein